MPSTGPPDILARRLERLTDNDLRFLVENFPEPAASYEDIARIFASLPITLESTLDAEYAYRKIFENGRELVEISPFLLFNVLLHRCIGSAYTQTERVVVNYMANLLGCSFALNGSIAPKPVTARATSTSSPSLRRPLAPTSAVDSFCRPTSGITRSI